MSFDFVLEHIDSIKKDIDYIGTILQDHLPKLESGRAMIAMPSFKLEQSERDEIIEIAESIVTRVSEINQELVPSGPAWESHMQRPIQFSQQLYATALRVNEEQFPDDASLFDPLGNLRQSILALETTVKVTNATNRGTASQKSYSQSQVNAIIKEFEKARRETKLKAYNKLDPDLKKLSSDLLTNNPNTLDKAVDKLLHLMCFDTEIYDPGIAGNIDVIALDVREEIVCISENTTGKLSKSKVDQIAGRQKEYEEEYKSWNNLKVYPVLVCTNDTVFVDNIARRNAVLNSISVLTKNELEDLVKNVKKGKMSSSLFVEYIKKKIPKK